MRKAATPGMIGLILFVALTGLALAGCDDKISGTYLPTGDALFQKIEFGSGDTVVLNIGGADRLGTYKIDGKKMVITTGPDSIVVSINDKGCLDGGKMGTWCKK